MASGPDSNNELTEEELAMAQRAIDSARRNPMRRHNSTSDHTNEDDDLGTAFIAIPLALAALGIVAFEKIGSGVKDLTVENWNRIKRLFNNS